LIPPQLRAMVQGESRQGRRAVSAGSENSRRIRNALIGVLTIATFIGCGLAANAQERDSFIDYDGFLGVSEEVAAYRQQHLVSLVDFNEMKAEPGYDHPRFPQRRSLCDGPYRRRDQCELL
jgi:hypothetical protein